MFVLREILVTSLCRHVRLFLERFGEKSIGIERREVFSRNIWQEDRVEKRKRGGSPPWCRGYCKNNLACWGVDLSPGNRARRLWRGANMTHCVTNAMATGCSTDLPLHTRWLMSLARRSEIKPSDCRVYGTWLCERVFFILFFISFFFRRLSQTQRWLTIAIIRSCVGYYVLSPYFATVYRLSLFYLISP